MDGINDALNFLGKQGATLCEDYWVWRGYALCEDTLDAANRLRQMLTPQAVRTRIEKGISRELDLNERKFGRRIMTR